MDALKQAQARLTMLSTVNVNVATYGGWTKFVADYRAVLVKAVQEEGTEDD